LRTLTILLKNIFLHLKKKKTMKKTLLLFVSLFFYQFGISQTVGLLYHDQAVSEGYTLFTPQKNNKTFLVNSCGEKVNEWTYTELPGATCYLMANGNLMRAGKDHIEVRDWNNNVVWSYATTVNNIAQHHDIHPLPNGNVICLATEFYPLAEMTNRGRNPANTAASFRMEKVVEIQPTGLTTGVVVWEWKFIDHIVQDFDATKLNYGVVADHPELLDINYNNGNPVDFIHPNSIDYNPVLDQILISARHLNEIYIIDHSTTTLQASGHTGGNSNLGGDLLWRWGNPEAYKQGTTADRKLYFQHDAKWVESGYLDDGKITVFNNGDAATVQDFTSVVMLQPEIVNNVYIKSNNKFNPATYDWSWNGSILGIVVDQDKMSGTHAMPNGNIIISETSLGRVSEITKTGTVLWSYKNPTGPIVNSNTTYYNQNQTILASGNSFFRAEKYPANFAGFTGRDMTSATGIIENENSLSAICTSLASPEFTAENLFILNPATNHLIKFSRSITVDTIKIFDTNGRLVYNQQGFVGDKIEVSLTPSLYFIQIQEGSFIKKLKVIVSK
jgi:hypothetical protein